MGKIKGMERRKPKKKSVKAKVTFQMNAERRRSRMGKKVEKGLRGTAANFLSRAQALKKLQVTLKDFRRLCILKGIYPRDPKKRPDRKSRHDKVYYHLKDVVFLQHEPLLQRFRDFKAFMKKVRRAAGRKETSEARRLWANRPDYSVSHLVRERYPRFVDAVADLDDALCLVHLYAALPGNRKVGGTKASKAVRKCARLVKEWQLWICQAGALRKVFVSVKGIYFQAEVEGTPVTWVQPHPYKQKLPGDVDFRVMGTFLEFYETFVRFVLFRLYSTMSLLYPPKIEAEALRSGVPLSQLTAGRASDPNPTFTGEEITGVKETPEAEEKAEDGSEEEEQARIKKEKKLLQKRMRKAKKALKDIAEREEQALEAAQADDEKQGAEEGDDDEGDEDNEDNEDNEDDEDDEDNEDDEDDEDDEGGEEEPGDGSDDEATGKLAAPLAEAFRSLSEMKDDGDEDPSADVGDHARLLKGLKVFLGREVPREWVEFVLIAFGAEVGFDAPGSLFAAEDSGITHIVVDRPTLDSRFANRNVDLVQPQWIFDSCNAGVLLPCDKYAPGKALPPHLSPFVDDDREGYTPAYAEEIERIRKRKRGEADDEPAASGEPDTPDTAAAADDADGADEPEDASGEGPKAPLSEIPEQDENKELAKSMMGKKARRLYDRMQHGIKKRKGKVEKLMEKRRLLEKKRADEGRQET